MVLLSQLPTLPAQATPRSNGAASPSISVSSALLEGGDTALVNQLRRISRNAGIQVSINDSPETLCERLLERAPQQLGSVLQSTLSPMFVSRREAETGTVRHPFISSSVPSTPLAASRHSPHPAQTDRRPATQHGGSTERTTTRTYLGSSQTEYQSVGDYLQKRNAAIPAPPTQSPRHEGSPTVSARQHSPPEHSVVLSRVIASAERLEMEFAHAVLVASADAAKAVEAARLEALRAHVRGLHTVKQQCLALQREAETKLEAVTRELEASKEESRKNRQEATRLRFMLGKEQALHGSSKAEASVMKAFGAKGKKRGGSMQEMLATARQEEAWQHQLDASTKQSEAMAVKLDEAQSLSDGLSAQLAEAKRGLADAEANGAEKLSQAESQTKLAKREAEEARLRHEKDVVMLKEQIAKLRTALKIARATASAGSVGAAAKVAKGQKSKSGTDPRVPPGGSISANGVILDANGEPVLGADGKPLVVDTSKVTAAAIPPNGSVGYGGVILDATGQPVLGEDGKPLVISNPRIPPGGSIGPGGVLLDANGKVVLGRDGKPIYADPRVPPGGSIGPDGVILDAQGKPMRRADGTMLYADPGALPLGWGQGTNDDVVQLPSGGSVGPGGVVLDAEGNVVLGSDGKPLRFTDPRVPAGGSIGAGGVILDANGEPVLGADGKPLVVDTSPRVPPGGSVGPGGVILDANGEPVLGADGKPLVVTDPRVPAGGSIGAGGIILDANGEPVLGADGVPLYAAAAASGPEMIPPGGSVGSGGVVLDANGEPVLGSDGKPLMIIDSRVPSGGSIGAGGVILDANGEPVLGADGVPLYAAAVKAPALDAPKKIKQKRARKSEIVAAGRMLTLTRMRARDVPDLDAQNPKPGRRRNPNDVSDPYLSFTVIDDEGADVDFARTPHLENQTHPVWNKESGCETLRLFVPDDDTKGSRTAPVTMMVRLWDHDKGGVATDDMIGEAQVVIKAGKGKVKLEIPSQYAMCTRPHVYFHYRATPQMFFEQVEYVRVSGEEVANAAEGEGGDSDDEQD